MQLTLLPIKSQLLTFRLPFTWEMPKQHATSCLLHFQPTNEAALLHWYTVVRLYLQWCTCWVAASAAEAATSHRQGLSVHIKVRDGYEKSPKRIAKQPQMHSKRGMPNSRREIWENALKLSEYCRWKRCLCLPFEIADRCLSGVKIIHSKSHNIEEWIIL